MAAEKSPAFQFYPQDWLADDRVEMMPSAAVGCYWTLCCHAWLKQNLPSDLESLRKLARYRGTCSEFEKSIWPHVVGCFQKTSTGWIQPRIERERQKQASFRERGRLGGLASAKLRASKRQANVNSSSSSSSKEDLGNSNNKLEREISVSTTSEKGNGKPSLSAAAPSDPFTDKDITERAGRFVERYQVLYAEHRHGARYALRPARDYAAAVTLCQTWTDEGRLEKLAICFLTTNHRFAEEGSRTLPQFLALASWADGELAKWELKTNAKPTSS